MSVIKIIINKDAAYYDGDLKHYFRVVWHSPNILMPYHNLRHMLHVMWATHVGIMHHADRMSRDEVRALLIAALFHDYNHSGRTGDDAVNIKVAIDGMRTHLVPADRHLEDKVVDYIRATQFPHVEGEFTLPAMILRDVDVAYTLSDVWIQLVNFGLNQEIGISPESMLRAQGPFLNSLKFYTEWGREQYEDRIKPRIEEAEDMVRVLFGNP